MEIQKTTTVSGTVLKHQAAGHLFTIVWEQLMPQPAPPSKAAVSERQGASMVEVLECVEARLQELGACPERMVNTPLPAHALAALEAGAKVHEALKILHRADPVVPKE